MVSPVHILLRAIASTQRKLHTLRWPKRRIVLWLQPVPALFVCLKVLLGVCTRPSGTSGSDVPSQTMYYLFSCVTIGEQRLAGQRRTIHVDAHVKGFVGGETFGAVERFANDDFMCAALAEADLSLLLSPPSAHLYLSAFPPHAVMHDFFCS